MKKWLVLFSMLFIVIGFSFSQDLIIQKNGKEINCKISKVDSTTIYFSIEKGDNMVDTYIHKSDVEKLIYEKDKPAIVYSDSITTEKSGLGYQYYCKGHMLTLGELSDKLKVNDLAYSKLESAKSVNTVASILGCIGGFCVGYTLGTAIGGGETSWVLAGIGVGVIIIDIPIAKSAEKKAKEAVHIYNSGIKKKSSSIDNELRLRITKEGIGFCMNF